MYIYGTAIYILFRFSIHAPYYVFTLLRVSRCCTVRPYPRSDYGGDPISDEAAAVFSVFHEKPMC